MKLIRFSISEANKPRLGVLTPLGVIDAASCFQAYHLGKGEEVPELAVSPIELLKQGPEALKKLETASKWALSRNASGTVLFHQDKVQMLAPIERPGKIICIGQNYLDHCKEQGKEPPTSPMVFSKFQTAVQNPGGEIVHPRVTQELDFEAELGVVIGNGGRHIAEEKALEHVAGYLNINDVTARDLQRSDGQWIRGKSCDTFAPMGPALVTADEIADPQDLRVQTRVNGETMQDSNTKQMIFPVSHLIAFLSEFTTLETGDVIATGTPPGVGVFRKPPVFLKAGDVVEVEVQNLGILRNLVVNES